jgi:hypothetical protein
MADTSNTGPVPRLGAVTRIHTDPDGQRWHLTVHWARVNGTATPVGLDLRAFTGDSQTRLRPTGGVLTAAVLRSLRIADVVEETRRQGTWATPTRRRRGVGIPKTGGDAPTRRAGRPAERGDDFIAEVAALYHDAKAQGGEPARKPWRYVIEHLEARGIHDVTDGQLKNWSRRAKNLGLLPAAETNKKEKR